MALIRTPTDGLLPFFAVCRRVGSCLVTGVGLLALVAIAGCSSDEVILKGERIAVLPERSVIASDPAAFAEGAGLPPKAAMMAASVVGLGPGHAGGHLDYASGFKRQWSASIGGKGSALVELAPPVIADGRVYTVAPNGTVSAFDIETGAKIWQTVLEEMTDDPLPGVGGGLAVTVDGLAVHAGGRHFSLLTLADGTEKWTAISPLPLRGGPTVVDDKAVVVTDLDGNLLVFLLPDGTPVWDRAGLASNTVMFGAPSPAYANGELVVVGARGEITLFNADDGELLWTDSVAVFNPRTPVERLGDIRAHPVHDGGMIFVVSQSGRLAAFSARSGLPLWDQPVASIEMPWLAGETLFVMGLDGRLYALRRADGAVRWVAELPGALAPDVVVSEKQPRYVGPIVAGGQVLVISSQGRLHAFNPDTGVEVATKSLSMAVLTAPQIAAGRLFVLGSNGTLSVFD